MFGFTTGYFTECHQIRAVSARDVSSIWTGPDWPTRIARTQRYSGARVIRFAHLMCRRVATALAVVAALALAANGALGSNHHMSAAAGHHHDHGESHSHGAHGHSHADHSHHNVDMAAVDLDEAVPSSPDVDADCYLNACFAAVVLPCPSAHVLPVLFFGTLASAQPGQAKGVEPGGPRKPPRTSAPT
jgi:hypothetical protein